MTSNFSFNLKKGGINYIVNAIANVKRGVYVDCDVEEVVTPGGVNILDDLNAFNAIDDVLEEADRQGFAACSEEESEPVEEYVTTGNYFFER